MEAAEETASSTSLVGYQRRGGARERRMTSKSTSAAVSVIASFLQIISSQFPEDKMRRTHSFGDHIFCSVAGHRSKSSLCEAEEGDEKGED